MTEEPDYKTILFNLIANLTLAEHMGDASNYADDALKAAGLDTSEIEWEDVGKWLCTQGLSTLKYWEEE